MAIRHRPMVLEDIRECAEIIATHPVLGPRYQGRAMADLCAAWPRILNSAASRTTVFRADDDPKALICTVGVSVIVNDDFVRELKGPRQYWYGPELAKRILTGHSPLLSERQIREANSRGGLNLVTWEGCLRAGFENDQEIPRHIMQAFIAEHRGYRWKEIIGVEVESAERLLWTIESGGSLWDRETGQYVSSLKDDPKEIVRRPHVIGLTRESERKRPHPWGSSWVGTLFDYNPPKCSFTGSEQRMLLEALDGGTDQELSKSLGVSLSTVKKMWLSIYRRMADRLQEFSMNDSQPGTETTQRGKEKKRWLLAYLRDHYEELRPFSPRLLRQSATLTVAGKTPGKKHRGI